MKPKLDIELIRNKIHNVEDVNLKSITDLVAFKIAKSPDDRGAEENFDRAEKVTAEYVSENFSTMGEFYEGLKRLDEGVKGMQILADIVHRYYLEKDHLSFDVVKNNISSKKDITLKTITDLVAFSISKSEDSKGPDLNFISAQTFVAEYVSKHFKNEKEFEDKLSELGEDVKGLSAFADIVYNYFVNKNG